MLALNALLDRRRYFALHILKLVDELAAMAERTGPSEAVMDHAETLEQFILGHFS